MKRVILWFQRQLLCTTVVSILQEREDLELIVIGSEKVAQVAMIDSVKPDVIITDTEMMAEHHTSFTRFLHSYPTIRTIVLQLDSNKMQVCDKQSMEVERIADFLDLM